MKSLIEEVEQAWVRLTRNKTLTFVKIILLAVGLGCCIAVFTIYNSVLLKPSPHENAEDIVFIGQLDETRPGRLTWANHYVYEEVKRRIPELKLVGYSAHNNADFETGDFQESTYGMHVSPELFEVLGDKAAIGETLSRSNTENGSKRLVLITDSLWERAFERSTNIVGTSVFLNKVSHEVCGILPENYRFLGRPTLYGPQFFSLQKEEDIPNQRRKSRFFQTWALLDQSVPISFIEEKLSAITEEFQVKYPEFMARKKIVVRTLREFSIHGVSTQINIIMAVGLLVLILTIANVSQLCLAQGISRTRDYSIRLSLGAKLRHLFYSVFIEYALITFAAGILGAVISIWLKNKIVERIPEFYFEITDFDWRILLFVFVVVGLVSLFSAIIPVWQMRNANLETLLREGGSRSTGSTASRRFGKLLIFFQIALCTGLLIQCGLMLFSAHQRNSLDRNANLENLYGGAIHIRDDRYPEQYQKHQFIKAVVEEFRNHPKVVEATEGNARFPRLGESGTYSFIDDDDDMLLSESNKFVYRPSISPEHFDVFGVKLLAGRVFTEEDTLERPRVAIVSKKTVDLYFDGKNPIGKRIKVNHRTDDWSEIIGVVEDRYSVDDKPELVPMIYRPMNYYYFQGCPITLRIRDGMSFSYQEFIETLQNAFPGTSCFEVASFKDSLHYLIWRTKLISDIIAVFSVVAFLLTAFGIFSVTYFSVSQRMGEFSLRSALGAKIHEIRNSIVGESILISGIGFLFGLGFSIATRHLIVESLYKVDSWIPVNYAVILVLILVSSLIGSLIPAIRAAYCEPLKYLREG